MGRVDGKIALVTGAAVGLGRAIAEILAREGATVVLTDIDSEAGHSLARHMDGEVQFVAHDVRKDESWRSVTDAIIRHHGRVDILVNNAGVTGNEAAEDVENVTLAAWRAVHAVNVEGVILGCKWGVRAMKRAGGGAIVNISSMAGLTGTPSLPAYGASKAAVHQITKTVALHCASHSYGIRCNSVHPGYMATKMLDDAFAPEQRDNILSTIPLGAFGTAEDVAQAVIFLTSDESLYLTGTRLIVDGGVTMR